MDWASHPQSQHGLEDAQGVGIIPGELLRLVLRVAPGLLVLPASPIAWFGIPQCGKTLSSRRRLSERRSRMSTPGG